MKLARFAIAGKILEGALGDDGGSIVSAGVNCAADEVTLLPPVVPTKVIGLALNFADRAEITTIHVALGKHHIPKMGVG